MYASQCKNVSPKVPHVAGFLCKDLRTCVLLGHPPWFFLLLRSLRLVLLPALFPLSDLGGVFSQDQIVEPPTPLSNQRGPAHPPQCQQFASAFQDLFPFYMYGVFCLHVCLCTVCLSDTCGGQKEASYPLGYVDSREIPCGCSDPLLLQLELNWGKVVREEHSVPCLCGRGLWVHCCG